jgi:hypothetical protein
MRGSLRVFDAHSLPQAPARRQATIPHFFQPTISSLPSRISLPFSIRKGAAGCRTPGSGAVVFPQASRGFRRCGFQPRHLVRDYGKHWPFLLFSASTPLSFMVNLALCIDLLLCSPLLCSFCFPIVSRKRESGGVVRPMPLQKLSRVVRVVSPKDGAPCGPGVEGTAGRPLAPQVRSIPAEWFSNLSSLPLRLCLPAPQREVSLPFPLPRSGPGPDFSNH